MRGHLFPAVAILAELQRRGHEIAIRTLSSEVATLQALGFDYLHRGLPREFGVDASYHFH